MRKILLLIILIGCAPFSAGGADWQLVSENEENKIYVNKESIQYNSDYSVRALFNTIPKIPLKIFEKYLHNQIAYEEQNCKEHKFRFLQVTGYHYDGTTEQVISEPSEWIQVSFSTIFKEKHKYLCND